jgi:hypothetical protein
MQPHLISTSAFAVFALFFSQMADDSPRFVDNEDRAPQRGDMANSRAAARRARAAQARDS